MLGRFLSRFVRTPSVSEFAEVPTSQVNALPNSALSVINNIQDKNLQNEYLFNYYGIKEQQSFAERMARNSFQYAVEDLRKAGLNPYMLYSNGGSGATTPSTSAFTASPYASSKYSADSAYKGVKYSSDTAYRSAVETARIKAISDVASAGIGALGRMFRIVLK